MKEVYSMKHVYLIITGCEYEEGVFEIFSSEKKANERLKELLADKYWRTTSPHVEKWEVK